MDRTDVGAAKRRQDALGGLSGVRAIEYGVSVGFHHLDNLRHDRKQDAEVPPTRVNGKKYLRNSLLLVDEVGFRQLTRQEAVSSFTWRHAATKRAAR